MPRYFYTDPLAAAWMAKHYGMRFRLRANFFDLGIHYRLDWTDVTAWSINCFDDMRGQYSCSPLCPAEALYIHPDSIHVLEPMVGDLCLFKPHKYGHIEETAHRQKIGGKEHEVVMLEGFYEEASYFEAIIQRDSKPFFWPEREE